MGVDLGAEKVTDAEILARLAEIEGPPIFRWSDAILLKHPYVSPYDDGYGEEWNPLVNWADLGPLIEKYAVSTEPVFEAFTPSVIVEEWEAMVYVEKPYKGKTGMLPFFGRHSSLPHAICLAIIEAHK